MNALLNAMKRINGGTSEDVALAMQRLEKAFATVERSIESGKVSVDIPSIPKPEIETQSEEQTPTEPPIASGLSAQSGFATPVSASVPTEAPSNDPTMLPHTETEYPVSAAQKPTIPSPPIARTTEVVHESSGAFQQSNQSVPESIAEKLQKQKKEREALLSQTSAKVEAEKAANEADPLHSNEVTIGLQQLLSEWKLFKGSGIFGTGPGGYDHPLYKTLSALPMSAVVTGRFEGSTDAVQQSLSDYMSGWRYEQNVVHEMSENFEHYLRRVIYKILTRQKESAQSVK